MPNQPFSSIVITIKLVAAMKISKKTNQKKRIIIFTLLFLLLAGAAIGAYLLSRTPAQDSKAEGTRPMNDVRYQPATEEEKQATEETKEAINEEQQQSEQPQPADSITVTIVRASQSGSGQPLNIRASVSGITSGTCEVTLSKDSQPTIAKSFPVVFEATSASCSGANIDAAEFSTSGEWNIKVVAKNDSLFSKAAESTAMVQK